MDKTKHPGWLIVLTYAVMAFSRAGKDLLTFPDMIICGLAGIVLGTVMVITEKFNLPTYICRGAGAFAASLFIIFTASARTNINRIYFLVIIL